LLDAPAEVGLARAAGRAGQAGTDRFEAEQVEFFRRVREKYLDRARAEPARVEVVDATRTATEVAATIQGILGRRLP